MKKLLAILLAILMVATFAACGGNKDNTNTDEPAKEPVSDDAAASGEEGVDLGITSEQYAEMTVDALIDEIFADKTAPTNEEYAKLLQTIDFVEYDDNLMFDDNITTEAMDKLKDEDAAPPSIFDAIQIALANPSAKVRGFCYSEFYNKSFEKGSDYYNFMKTKCLAETEAIAIVPIFRYVTSNFWDDAEFFDFVASFKDNEDANIRKWLSKAISVFIIEDNEKAVEIMLELLKDENQAVKSNAALYCGNMQDDRFVEPLAEILKDENLAAMHNNAADSLIKMWYDYPAHANHSAKAYEATMNYFKGEYSSEDLPNWQALNKLANKGATAYDKWLEGATYLDTDEIVEAMTNIFKDLSKDKLVRTQCISVIGCFGDKADLEALQSVIDSIENETEKSSLQSKLDGAVAKFN